MVHKLSQTLSYLRSETCFSSYLSLLPRTLSALSVLPSLVARTCQAYRFSMVQTSKTDHFFKLAPFWSPLTDLIDFGMAGKLLTSATR